GFREGGPDQRGEDVAESILGVELGLCLLQGIGGASERDESGDRAVDHKGDGNVLSFERPELAEELLIRGFDLWICSGVRRLEFLFTLSIRPSAMVTTRWASCAMAALWVMTAVVAPSPWLTRSSASSTTFPVRMSSAPVGSSQRRMSGFLAMARAMAT